jgi:hypothetical protein
MNALCNAIKKVPEADALEALLSTADPALVGEALRQFTVRSGHTFLTDAVFSMRLEDIAILLYYGADPLQECPSRDNLSAFDFGFTHCHAQNRDRFHFIMAMLNPGTMTASRGMYREDYTIGKNPNTPLHTLDIDGNEVIRKDCETPLTFAIVNNLPYCVRWLCVGRRADVDVPNGRGDTPHMMQMPIKVY